MAIAIQVSPTTTSPLYSDVKCHTKEVSYNTNDPTKPVLNAIFQGLWGVSAVTNLYDVPNKDKRTEFLWALHEFPFKHFENPLDGNIHKTEQWLSFRERDAVLRHQIYYDIQTVLQDCL